MVSVGISRMSKNRVIIEPRWTLLSAGARWWSATRNSYKMSALHVDVQQDGTPSQTARWTSFHVASNSQYRSSQLHCFGCHSTDGVPPATTQFSRGAPACESVSRANSQRFTAPVECVIQQQGRHIETLNLNETVNMSLHCHNLCAWHCPTALL